MSADHLAAEPIQASGTVLLSLSITEVISKVTRHDSALLGHEGIMGMLWGEARGIALSSFS